jgi:pimeloyl-ACP methyl ester carboxylesterase
MIATNGIQMHVAEQGEGPLVVLCHGFPELWYSWRYQIEALAEAGYHVVAPDQRGYGRTDRPEGVEEYDIVHLTDDLLGLLDALGEERAVFIGHDWGGPVVWHLAQRAPARVRAVGALSVPFVPRGLRDPITSMKATFGDNFFYILYFQEPGVADADLDRDPFAGRYGPPRVAKPREDCGRSRARARGGASGCRNRAPCPSG